MLILGAEAYLFIIMRPSGDDIAGGVAMGLFILSFSDAIAAIATVLKKRLVTTLTEEGKLIPLAR